MEFSIKTPSPDKTGSDCLILSLFEGKKRSATWQTLDKASGGALEAVVQRGDMRGKRDSHLLLPALPGVDAQRVLLVGLGKEKEFNDAAFLKSLRGALKAIAQTAAKNATLFLADWTVDREMPWKIRQSAMVWMESNYQFSQFKQNKDKDEDKTQSLKALTVAVPADTPLAELEQAMAQGLAIGHGVHRCRDLGNMPPNLCNPAFLAHEAQRLAKDLGLECTVLGREALQELGMNALLSVARGSAQAPQLIALSYRGGKKSQKPILLVGKGVTFDSGGISLKPGADMDEMKFDMCGAASVIGTLEAVARMALPLNLVVLVPAVENMPGSNASRPGDIVTSMSGQSIEILNTDAEGRLILCDTLTYAERYKPEAVIDVATLTGACVVALGHVATGLFANQDSLARELLAAGETAQDRAWQLPLWEEYQPLLKSTFADMGNIGGRWGGAITAACFLSRFSKTFTWAHLDIAGTAWEGKEATGRPVALLSHYLLQRAGKLS